MNVKMKMEEEEREREGKRGGCLYMHYLKYFVSFLSPSFLSAFLLLLRPTTYHGSMYKV